MTSIRPVATTFADATSMIEIGVAAAIRRPDLALIRRDGDAFRALAARNVRDASFLFEVDHRDRAGADVRDERTIVRRRERNHVRAVLICVDRGGDLAGFDIDDQQSLRFLCRHRHFVTA